jgi:putative transposase
VLAGQEASTDGKSLFVGSSRAGGRRGRARRSVTAQAAARFGVGIKTAIEWVKRFRQTGSVAALPMGGRQPKIVGEYRDWLIRRCRSGDFTLRGLVAELADRGLQVDYHTMWTFVHAEGLSHKKRR